MVREWFGATCEFSNLLNEYSFWMKGKNNVSQNRSAADRVTPTH
jgi:hypothetical protein